MKIGKTRILFEDIVRRAERKFSEAARKSTKAQTEREKAEQLTQELFHRPGKMLTKDELERILAVEEARCPLRPQKCNNPMYLQFRTITGICNNLKDSLRGSANTAFRRLLPAWYEDGVSVPRGRLQARDAVKKCCRPGTVPLPFDPPNPSARIISTRIVLDIRKNENPFSHIFMQWGQFLDHDLDLAPESEVECKDCTFSAECEPIRVPKDDKKFGRNTVRNGKCLPLKRSLPACDSQKPTDVKPLEQLNALSSFIDGSMIYGSEEVIAKAVRGKAPRGQLLTGPRTPSVKGGKPTLPFASDSVFKRFSCLNNTRFPRCFMAGDVRVNEQPGLTTMHTIFLREHNRLARRLFKLNHHWSHERVYQEARKIVGAIIQKITYYDYLTKVLGRSLYNSLIGRYRGYNPHVDPSIPNVFATAAFRYGHSQIQPFIQRFDANFKSIGSLPLFQAFFNITAFMDGQGTDPLLRGLVRDFSRRVDEFINTDLSSRLFEMANKPGTGMDLASLNIQRGREHGLPPYTHWRHFCRKQFPKLPTSDIENQKTFIRLLRTYGSLDTVDLWLGGLAEERLSGSVLGSTLSCLFAITFRDVRNGDRFYFENPRVFSRQQRKQIMQSSLSRIICDNSDNINSIQRDAFVRYQKSTACSKLPRINLRPWKERACYVRIQQDFRRSAKGKVTVGVGLATQEQNFQFSTGRFNSNKPICLSIPYPRASGNDQFGLFLVSNRGSRFRFRCNRKLPQIKGKKGNVFTFPIKPSLLNANSGLYTSLGACKRSTAAAAFKVSCKNRAFMSSQEIDDEDVMYDYQVAAVPADNKDSLFADNEHNSVSDEEFEELRNINMLVPPQLPSSATNSHRKASQDEEEWMEEWGKEWRG